MDTMIVTIPKSMQNKLDKIMESLGKMADEEKINIVVGWRNEIKTENIVPTILTDQFSWNEPWQGKQTAKRIKLEWCNSGHWCGYYLWTVNPLRSVMTGENISDGGEFYFAVRTDGRITAFRNSLDEIKEIVKENW